jgi:hypothetical protein
VFFLIVSIACGFVLDEMERVYNIMRDEFVSQIIL